MEEVDELVIFEALHDSSVLAPQSVQPASSSFELELTSHSSSLSLIDC